MWSNLKLARFDGVQLERHVRDGEEWWKKKEQDPNFFLQKRLYELTNGGDAYDEARHAQEVQDMLEPSAVSDIANLCRVALGTIKE